MADPPAPALDEPDGEGHPQPTREGPPLSRDHLVAGAEENLFRSLLEAAPDAMVIVDGAGEIVLVNAQTEKLLGYRREELLGQRVEVLVPERLRGSHERLRQGFAAHPTTRPMGAGLELHVRRKDGVEVPAEISLSPLETRTGTLVSAAVRDISTRKRIEQANRRLAAIVQNTDDAILGIDPDGTLTDWNRGARNLFGYPEGEAIGRSLAMLVPADRAGEDRELMRRVMRGHALDQHETVFVRSDGARVDVAITVSPIKDPSGEIVGAAAVARDISERKHFEGQLQYLADHDALTGLYNRRRFEEELRRELARARRYTTGGAVLAIDLDHFKYVNDSLGHSVGDELITRAGGVLRDRVRTTDVLARMGGDEFALILPGVTPEEARVVAASLLEALRSECHVETPAGRHHITASIGIAPFVGSDDMTGEDLMVEADIAMYDAKEAGRDRARTYSADEDRHRRMQERLNWTDRIRLALEEDRFELHAQPIVALDGNPAPRHELLLRMIGEDEELIPPEVFLYVAERMGLVGLIDRWVLHRGIAVLAGEQKAGRDVRLELNISAMSVGDPDLPGWIGQELRAAGADGRGLCLEITETAAIVKIQQAKSFADQVREFGCEFALDDFGAGFASFYYLKHLTFDYLKIDGEFITGLAESRTDQLVVQSVVDIAHGLGKRTIAEFVGSAEALSLLQGYGVDYAQGFYVATPRPLEELDLGHPPLVLPEAVESRRS